MASAPANTHTDIKFVCTALFLDWLHLSEYFFCEKDFSCTKLHCGSVCVKSSLVFHEPWTPLRFAPNLSLWDIFGISCLFLWYFFAFQPKTEGNTFIQLKANHLSKIKCSWSLSFYKWSKLSLSILPFFSPLASTRNHKIIYCERDRIIFCVWLWSICASLLEGCHFDRWHFSLPTAPKNLNLIQRERARVSLAQGH